MCPSSERVSSKVCTPHTVDTCEMGVVHDDVSRIVSRQQELQERVIQMRASVDELRNQHDEVWRIVSMQQEVKDLKLLLQQPEFSATYVWKPPWYSQGPHVSYQLQGALKLPEWSSSTGTCLWNISAKLRWLIFVLLRTISCLTSLDEMTYMSLWKSFRILDRKLKVKTNVTRGGLQATRIEGGL